MLCLFCLCCAFFEVLVLGIGKLFKINELQVFWGWCGFNSQNLEKGGAGELVFKRCKRTRAKNSHLLKISTPKNGKSKTGNWSLLLYYIFIFIFILIIILCVSLRAVTMIVISACNSWRSIFSCFLIVKNSKSQHMQKKSHDKKPLHFCNMKKLVKTNTYKN